jgi:uncharacterized protein YxeA
MTHDKMVIYNLPCNYWVLVWGYVVLPLALAITGKIMTSHETRGSKVNPLIKWSTQYVEEEESSRAVSNPILACSRSHETRGKKIYPLIF